MVQRIVRSWATLCGILVLAMATQGAAADYDHTVESGKMKFSWSVKGEMLAAKVSAATTGWVGVGFNPSQMMKDANFVIGFVRNGKAIITDQFGSAITAHTSDKRLGSSDNVTVVGGKEEGGETTLEFTIPLNSGDAYDKAIHVDGDTTLLLAYGTRDTFLLKHQYRATLTVNLGTGEVK